jgi:hypothetical protein
MTDPVTHLNVIVNMTDLTFLAFFLPQNAQSVSSPRAVTM